MEARRQSIGWSGGVSRATHCRPAKAVISRNQCPPKATAVPERCGNAPRHTPTTPSPRTRSGVHSAARGTAGTSCRPSRPGRPRTKSGVTGWVGRLQCIYQTSEADLCVDGTSAPHAPTCAGATHCGGRNRAQKAPSPRTRSGVHSAARGMAGASCRPLAARWTPDQVRGDGVGGAASTHIPDA